MKRATLTINRIDKLTCPAGKAQVFMWDAETPGLGIRCTPTRKTFIFQGELHGKTLRVTIGEYPAWRLDALAGSDEPNARRRARELRGMIDQGIDPREVEKQAKAESERQQVEAARKDVTLADVWPRYISANAGRWSEKHKASHEQMAHVGGAPRVRSKVKVTVAGPLASLLAVRLADLTAERVAEWLKKENTSRPTAAALAFRLLRACLNWCEEQTDLAGLVPANAHSAKKVRVHLTAPSTKDDCLQREQLAAWFSAVRELGNPVQSAYLQTLFITGARREELAGLRWCDVDFQWHSMSIRDKVEGERVIPLTPYVASLLASLPHRNEWVFSSPTAAGGRIVEPRIAHNRALVVAGLPNLSLHGLRRSFGTLAEWVECPVGVVAQIQGHKPSAIAEKHYRRRPLDLLRKWHTKIEGWILKQAGIKQPATDTSKRGLRVVA